jgi:hypothetical protein
LLENEKSLNSSTDACCLVHNNRLFLACLCGRLALLRANGAVRSSLSAIS